MIKKLILAISLVLVCCLLMSAQAFALSESDIAINIASPIDSLASESGVIAVEQFPAHISINTASKTGSLTEVRLDYSGQSQAITPNYTLTIENKEACGPCTVTAQTDEGAVLVVTANVVFQVPATYDTRYRTIGMNVKEIYEGETLLRSFPDLRRIDLVSANTVADHEQERIATWINRCDGGTYTLKGSLVVEIHNISTGEIYGTYDTDTDFESLTTRYGWTAKTLVAFETMRDTALSYQAPVKIDVAATWCDESKREIFGKLTAQDKGVPELLYPYQTTSVTFHKDDIKLSRNFIYCGLEWDYTPETAEYTDGESKTQTEITQKIDYQIPAAQFYFKFKACEGNDLSVAIRAPATVNRGDSYSFTVIYLNSGGNPAYDVPLKGTVDDVTIKEIPATQDFLANTSKAYEVKRAANTADDEIRLWAHIGVPAGFIDGNPDNNTATAIIKVVDPAPEPTPGNNDTPDEPDTPDNPGNPDNPPNGPPGQKEPCDLAAAILAPPTVYEYEKYTYTVSFTNHSGRELNAVPLEGKSDENTLVQIPRTAAFQPGEIKSFTIEGTAGKAGEIYHLWANVQAPEGFIDRNLSNNTAVSSITVVARPAGNPDNPNNPDTTPNPDNPDDPEEPDNPDNLDNLLCDVWVNLSSPPIAYQQEEYSFTVYFANSTGKALIDVVLNAAIDGKAVPSVPATANFGAYEKKSYPVTGTAGEKSTTIRLAAQVSPPVDYTDTNMGNNQAAAEIMVLERPYDLDVQHITPDRYKENQTVISTIRVSNQGSLDFTPGQRVSVLFQIPELSLNKRVDAVVMEQNTWNTVSVKWDTPNVQADKNVTLIATINPDEVLDNEASTSNNTYTQQAVIKNVTYTEPEESRALPDPPPRSEQPRVTWREQRYENGQFVWRQFYAELKVAAALDYDTKSRGYLKSGYGYSIRVTATVDSNYDKPELITAPQTAEVYLPEHRYETAIPLEKEVGQFVFRENPASPFLYRKQYVPIWFPDDRDYIAQLLVTDAHTPGGTLSKWITGGALKIYVVDSMYDDDTTVGN